MPNNSIDDLHERQVLEQLREQVARVDALERKIQDLEKSQVACEQQNNVAATELAQLREIREEWEFFFDNSLDMLCLVTDDGQVCRANHGFTRVLGYTVDEILLNPIDHYCHPLDKEIIHHGIRDLIAGNDIVHTELRFYHKDGSLRWISWTCPALSSPGSKMVAIGHDITESKLSQADLLFRAQHDPLTSLANRAMFDQTLAHAVARCERNPASEVALLIIDLDGFKAVNDCHGHAVGDEVLKSTASRLLSCQRKSDEIFRIGGDEFAWIIEGRAPLCLERLAQRVIDVVRKPADFDGAEVSVGCSIGIATYPVDGADNAETPDLYQQADAAMYSVKRNGKNSYARY